MSEIECPVAAAFKKMRNPDKVFKNRRVSLVFDSLPPQNEWSETLLDMSTRSFLNRMVYFLAKRGAIIQVSNESDTLVNTMARHAWTRYAPECPEASLEEVSEDNLFSEVSLVIGLGFSEKTMKKINQSKNPCVVVRTGINEVFPTEAIVVEREVEMAVSQAGMELEKLV